MRVALLYPVVSGNRIQEDEIIQRSVEVLITGLRDHRIGIQAFPITCSRDEENRLVFNSSANLQVGTLFEKADSFQIIHNHCGFFPLGYSDLVMTPIVSTLYHAPDPSLPGSFMDRSLYIAVSDKLRSKKLQIERVIYPGIPFPQQLEDNGVNEYLVAPVAVNGDSGIRSGMEIAAESGLPLVLCGNREHEQYFKNEIKPSVSNGQVSFRLVLDTHQRFELFSGARALLAFPEKPPISSLEIVEAMAVGTPVVAIRSGCLPELVDHGMTGFLLKKHSDTLPLIEKLGHFDREGCWSRAADRFSAKRMVDDYVSFFREVDRVHRTEGSRPWGFYSILADQPDHKVKRIVVLPGARLSLQRHSRRREHWFIHSGSARITLETKEIELHAEESIDIPRGSLHRIENIGEENLVFFEVQTGDYFGEDDIERLEDDFGRD